MEPVWIVVDIAVLALLGSTSGGAIGYMLFDIPRFWRVFRKAETPDPEAWPREMRGLRKFLLLLFFQFVGCVIVWVHCPGSTQMKLGFFGVPFAVIGIAAWGIKFLLDGGDDSNDCP